MNIKETFLKLTSHTYPYGTEDEVIKLLPPIFNVDAFGNLYLRIGISNVMFTAHLDTATKEYTKVRHVIDGKFINTDGNSILGADDKAGVTIMLNMIENNVPGLYYLFLGEEVGCIGSSNLSRVAKDLLKDIKKIISFDRRGYDSIITYQMGERCCSDKFAEKLSEELNRFGFGYKPDPTGLYTDSAQFMEDFPECTNISVGYFDEHRKTERQDIVFLEKLSNACLMVDWESLPVERDPDVPDYMEYGKSYKRSIASSVTITKTEKEIFYDTDYGYVTTIEYCVDSLKVVKSDFSPHRIADESRKIEKMLLDLGVPYDTMKWCGAILKLDYGNGHVTETQRSDLYEMLPELDISGIIYKSYAGQVF